MTSEIINIVLSFAQVVVVEGQVIFTPLKEVAMTSVEECWKMASEFNIESVGSGLAAYCIPVPQEIIVQ